jgi:predicted GNAT superfamily acetyltransferase
MTPMSSMGPEAEIREIVAWEEMRQVEELQQEIWGLTEREILPAIELWTAVHAGNLLHGAFADDRLAGFAYGVYGRQRGDWCLHSHIAGVRSGYRDRQIGLHLKLAQRERVLADGVRWITWTFDPLRSRNAHLNFRRLGVLCDDYRTDFYAGTRSAVTSVAGTDRLWVRWDVGSDRVERRLRGGGTPAYSPEDAAAVVWQNGDFTPECNGPLLEALGPACLGIAIPADIGLLQEQSAELAARWRMATRLAFSRALAAGYVVDDYFRPGRSRPYGVFTLLSPSAGSPSPAGLP